jgi:hypothetical protein
MEIKMTFPCLPGARILIRGIHVTHQYPCSSAGEGVKVTVFDTKSRRQIKSNPSRARDQHQERKTMSGYRKNAANNRDALFGSMGGTAGGATSKSSNKAGTKPATSSSIETTAPATTTTTRLPLPAVKSKGVGGGAAGISTLSAEARIAKQKEAEEYKTKANKCMESGIFKRPDPVAASTFYKRAADAYRVLNDTKLERLYRIESAECNRLCAAWPSAANDYTRAASLCDDSDAEEASKLHQKAAAAWTEAGETAKAAKSQVDAAMVFHQQQQSAEGGLIHLNVQ